jgi:hypothetical protein
MDGLSCDASSNVYLTLDEGLCKSKAHFISPQEGIYASIPRLFLRFRDSLICSTGVTQQQRCSRKLAAVTPRHREQSQLTLSRSRVRNLSGDEEILDTAAHTIVSMWPLWSKQSIFSNMDESDSQVAMMVSVRMSMRMMSSILVASVRCRDGMATRQPCEATGKRVSRRSWRSGKCPTLK